MEDDLTYINKTDDTGGGNSAATPRDQIREGPRIGCWSASDSAAPGMRTGNLGRRRWTRLVVTIGGVVALWLVSTMITIVPAGSVGVPVTLGHAGSPLGQGFHITPPLTSLKTMSARTTAYTMVAAFGEGKKSDDSVEVLGSDGASGSVDSTVLFRLEADQATNVYNELGLDYVTTLIRPSARTCIRSVFTDFTMVDAATTAWHSLEERRHHLHGRPRWRGGASSSRTSSCARCDSNPPCRKR